MKILVTGAGGSVGKALTERLKRHHEIVATDIIKEKGIKPLDVTGFAPSYEDRWRCDAVIHLAGAKHAPAGEEDPWNASRVNVVGTRNMLLFSQSIGAKFVLASTCKACDPETAYGATKLIAERMTLNAGGVVVRYYNIPEASGNVFRLWESIPENEPIPYTDCWRYFMSMENAVSLTICALELPTGRYTLDPGRPRHMSTVARDLYPERKVVEVERRRGDRTREPRHAQSEWIDYYGMSIEQIKGAHDL